MPSIQIPNFQKKPRARGIKLKEFETSSSIHISRKATKIRNVFFIEFPNLRKLPNMSLSKKTSIVRPVASTSLAPELTGRCFADSGRTQAPKKAR